MPPRPPVCGQRYDVVSSVTPTSVGTKGACPYASQSLPYAGYAGDLSSEDGIIDPPPPACKQI